MYIAINTDEMRMVHTGDYRQLCAFMLINFKDAGYLISPLEDAATYSIFTDMELRQIYRNATGLDYTGNDLEHLRNQVVALAAKVPECPVPLYQLEGKAEEIERQEWAEMPAPEPVKSLVKVKDSPAKPVSKPSGPVTRPKAGSATGRVWDIADSHYNEVPPDATINWKDMRAAIIAECESKGINAATAQVQFGKWKSTKI